MEENESVEMQEVAETAQTSEEMVEVAEQPTQEILEETQDEKPKFSEKDTAFANMRMEMEKYKSESEKFQSENKKYMETLQRFGFNGVNSEEILDQANAHYYGKTVEEIRNERIANEKAKQEHDAIVDKLQQEERKEIEEKMANDLAKIRKINPNIKSLDELGEPYFDLIRRGIDREKAYKLMEVEGLIQTQNTKIEQDTIRKMKANSKSSVGALDAVASKPKSVADMNDEEFEAYRQKALRGELMNK